MAVIRITRQHRHGTQAVREKVERIAQKLQSELDARYRWEGNTLKFARAGATGHIAVGESDLEVEVKLGILLSALRGTVEGNLRQELDKHLA